MSYLCYLVEHSGPGKERKPKDPRQPEPGVRELGIKTPVSVNSTLTRVLLWVWQQRSMREGWLVAPKLNTGFEVMSVKGNPSVLQLPSSETQARWKLEISLAAEQMVHRGTR